MLESLSVKEQKEYIIEEWGVKLRWTWKVGIDTINYPITALCYTTCRMMGMLSDAEYQNEWNLAEFREKLNRQKAVECEYSWVVSRRSGGKYPWKVHVGK